MSVSRSSAGSTVNNCCDPCDQCSKNVKSKKFSISKQTRNGGCTFSQSAVIRWSCTWTNSNLMGFTRCPNDRPTPEYRCTASVILTGSPTQSGTCACPTDCGKAKAAAIISANKSKPPPQTAQGTANWTEVPNSQCPLSCRPPQHSGPCYKLNGKPTPPNLPDQPMGNITWSC
jgi:hypothetical protein